MSYLLDTHILVWWRQDFKRLSKTQAQLLTNLEEKGQVAALSAISLRELAKMIQQRRIEVDMPLEPWLADVASHPLLTLLPISPRIAAESVRLGDDFHRDPADQIIVATARCHDLTLITADERIRRWGKVRVV
ncbi:MAG TPA: type II toxin-antitoxin system VapC family toxin [Bryobacteraceae bacterium]|nr:type II toxin-antitoxin system VapC family toxin [Bryobacteraceae bacterium]